MSNRIVIACDPGVNRCSLLLRKMINPHMNKKIIHLLSGGLDSVTMMYDANALPAGECRWIVRRNDGKIIKSPSYNPADIVSCLK